TVGYLVVGVDDENVFTRLLGADRGIRNEQRLIGRGSRHAHAREQAGREHAIGIVEYRAAANGAGRAVDDVVDEVHPARMIEILLVDQLERNGNAGSVAARDVVAIPGQALVAQIGRLVERELEPDRIGGYDGREQRGIAASAARHEVAGRDAPVAYTAGDGRTQLGEFHIQLGLADRRLVGADGSQRITVGLRALLESLVGDGLVAHELLAAVEVGFRECDVGFRLFQIRARLIDRVLERPLVDGEQEIALPDDLPILEIDAGEIARHARADFDGIDRDEAADIFVVIDDRALGRRRNRY